MPLSEYLLSGLLILVVVRQIRGRRLAGLMLYLPLVLVAVAAVSYLHGIPTTGNDLLLVLGGAAVGLALGTICAVFTKVYPGPGGVPYAKATWPAVVFWILGVSARLAFALYAKNGGGTQIAQFSSQHQLTIDAWAPCLIVMALVEVVSRTVVLVLRGYFPQLVHRSAAAVGDRPG
ncbi:MAG: DUF1453 domain-containing protein [Candidatus Dormiibacterota bacterium]